MQNIYVQVESKMGAGQSSSQDSDARGLKGCCNGRLLLIYVATGQCNCHANRLEVYGNTGHDSLGKLIMIADLRFVVYKKRYVFGQIATGTQSQQSGIS